MPNIEKHSCATPYPIYKIISCDTTCVLFPKFGENT